MGHSQSKTTSDDLPFVLMAIDPNDMQSGALQLLREIRPKWKQSDIEVEAFTQGISNRLLCCRWRRGRTGGEELLVRVYGTDLSNVYNGGNTDLLCDREIEILAMRVLQPRMRTQPIHCRFLNGMVYGYVDGVRVNADTVRDPHVWRLIANEIALLHSVDLVEAMKEHKIQGVAPMKKPFIFKAISQWLAMIPDTFDDPVKEERIKSEVCSRAALAAEFELMTREVQLLNSPIVFCHNDLQPNNIIYDQAEGKVTLLYFENAAYNYEAYDIAAHFAEHAGLYPVDYSNIPDKTSQLAWLRAFLEFKAQLRGGATVSDRDVETLYVQVAKFVLTTHLFSVLWSCIQCSTSKDNFDFIGYASTRYREYLRRREEYLALKLPD